MIFTVTKWQEILGYLHANKFRTDNYISNIAYQINISYDYTFKVINVLKYKGLVKKTIQKHDKRSKYIVITKKGEDLALDCFNIIKNKKRLL